jgi:ribose 5-phosphate isomerase B
MAELNPDTWTQSHMRWIALSRWDNEGGASPSWPTAGSAGASLRHDIRSSADLAGRKDPSLNVACLGGTVIVTGLALDLVHVLLNARFSGAPRHQRRPAKLRAIEHRSP